MTPEMLQRRQVPFDPIHRRIISIPILVANATFFVFGLSAWVFKFGDETTGTLLPYSFSQIFLPLTGLASVFLIVQIWRFQFPPLAIRAWSMRAVNCGLALIIVGLGMQFFIKGAYRVEALQVSAKWILPWCGILLIFTGRLFGGKADWMVYGLLAGSAMSVICVEANRIGVPIPISKLSASRVAGLLTHPNQYGILLSSLAPLIVYIMHKRGWINRMIGLASMGFFAIGLFECLSKTNIIIWPIMMAITLLLYACTDVKKFLRAIALIGLCAFAGVFLIGSGLAILQAQGGKDSGGMERFFADPSSMRSLDDRQDAWDEALQYLHESPWVGEGPGWAHDHLMFLHAHNLYLQVWIEVGILGLLGAILLTVGVLIRFWEIFHAVIARRNPFDDESRLQIAVVLGLLAAIFGNSMSASLSVETMIPFSLLVGLSFSNPKVLMLNLGR